MEKATPLNYELVKAKRWRKFLLTLPDDRTSFDLTFSSLDELKSFRASAYEINSDGVGNKVFSVSADKGDLRCTVSVGRR